MAEIRITVSGEDSASAAIQAAAASMQQLSGAVTEGTGVMQQHADLLPNFVSKYLEARTIWEGATTAYRDFVDLLKGSVEAYGEAEQAEVRLSAALNNTGVNVAQTSAEYDALAVALTNSSTVSKTAALEAEGTFTLIGKVGPEQMGAAMKAAADLAAGTGRSMDAITLAIAKASDGNVTALKRFGIQVDANMIQQDGFGAVIDAIEAKFSGQAETMSGTLLGSWQKMGNQWQLAQEQLGGELTPAILELMKGLSGLIGVVNESPAAFLTLVGASAALAASMAWMGAMSVYGAQIAAVGAALTTSLTGPLVLASSETVVFASAVTLAGAALSGLAVGAAAWLIGEWIGNVTGATAAIQHWAGAAGEAQLQAETLGAKQDVINNAVRLGDVALKDATVSEQSYAAAIAYTNKVLGDKAAAQTDENGLTVKQQAAADALTASLEGEGKAYLVQSAGIQQAIADGAADVGIKESIVAAIEKLIKAHQAITPEMADFLRANEDLTASHVKQVAAIERVSAADEAWRNSVTGDPKALDDLERRWATLTDTQRENPDVMALVTEQYDRLRPHLLDLPTELEAVRDATRELEQSQQLAATAVHFLTTQLGDVAPALQGVSKTFVEFGGVADGVINNLGLDIGHGLVGSVDLWGNAVQTNFLPSLQLVNGQTKEAAAATAGAIVQTNGWASSFTNLGNSITGNLVQALSGVKTFAQAFSDIWHTLLTDLLGSFVNNFLKGILNSLTGAKGGVTDAFSSMFGGLGSVLDGLGQNISSFVGSASSMIAGIGAAAAGVMGVIQNTSAGMDALSGAMAGAGIGSMIGGPLGAGIGAGIGAAAGALVNVFTGDEEQRVVNPERSAWFAQKGGPQAVNPAIQSYFESQGLTQDEAWAKTDPLLIAMNQAHTAAEWNASTLAIHNAGVPGFAAGTGGQFLDFGAGTDVILHGKERVMTEGEGRGSSSDAVMQALHAEIKGMRADLARMLQTQPIMLRHALRGA